MAAPLSCDRLSVMSFACAMRERGSLDLSSVHPIFCRKFWRAQGTGRRRTISFRILLVGRVRWGDGSIFAWVWKVGFVAGGCRLHAKCRCTSIAISSLLTLTSSLPEMVNELTQQRSGHESRVPLSVPLDYVVGPCPHSCNLGNRSSDLCFFVCEFRSPHERRRLAKVWMDRSIACFPGFDALVNCDGAATLAQSSASKSPSNAIPRTGVGGTCAVLSLRPLTTSAGRAA